MVIRGLRAAIVSVLRGSELPALDEGIYELEGLSLLAWVHPLGLLFASFEPSVLLGAILHSKACFLEGTNRLLMRDPRDLQHVGNQTATSTSRISASLSKSPTTAM